MTCRAALLDEDEGEQAAEEAVEHDCLGEREAEPHDSLELSAQLRLARDRLDHRPEDGADADACADGAETDAEAEGDRLAFFDLRRGGREQGEDGAHRVSLLNGLARWPSRCRWLTGRRR